MSPLTWRSSPTGSPNGLARASNDSHYITKPSQFGGVACPKVVCGPERNRTPALLDANRREQGGIALTEVSVMYLAKVSVFLSPMLRCRGRERHRIPRSVGLPVTTAGARAHRLDTVVDLGSVLAVLVRLAG